MRPELSMRKLGAYLTRKQHVKREICTVSSSVEIVIMSAKKRRLQDCLVVTDLTIILCKASLSVVNSATRSIDRQWEA